jgi:membrane protease FtsH catalytic subunit (EC 3.4.24.-)
MLVAQHARGEPHDRRTEPAAARRRENRPKINPKTQVHLGYWLLAIALMFMVQSLWSSYSNVQTVPYSEFQTYLKEGRIKDVVIGGQTITGTLKSPDANGKSLVVAVRVEPQLASELQKYGVTYSQQYTDTWLSDILSWVLPALIFVGLWFFLVRKFADKAGGMGMGGFMSIGKSRAKVYMENRTGVTFADVAGVDEAKAELEEVVDFLKNPGEHSRLGARAPKGVLLVGPPGVGKTLLARAVAGEAGGAVFLHQRLGVCGNVRRRGRGRVRDLFEQAREKSPAIIFIDELDALGRARSAAPFGGGHDEKEQTLNQLLVELDGFDSTSSIVILAATNRPEILDPALLRAGRFDRQVLVERPDKVGRVQILKVHAVKIRLDPSVDLEQVAALTPGFSGADLANLVNEAALLATRENARTVTLSHFTRAVERIVAGLEKRTACSTRKSATSWRITKWGIRWWPCRCRAAMRCTRCPSFRAASVRWVTPFSAHRRPLSDDPGRVEKQDDRAHGRAGCRASGVRPLVNRRGGRSGESHRHRPQHGDALRHGRKARRRQSGRNPATRAGHAGPAAAARIQRTDRAGNRLRRARSGE